MSPVPERDYIVREIELPFEVKGIVTPNPDGTFSIYINSKLSPDQKEKALEHEVKHIENDDFYNDESIEEIERNNL